MMTDPIADMLTRIRNASRVRHEEVEFPYSRLKFAVSQILQEKGYLARAEKTKEGGRDMVRLALKYPHGAPAITEIIRVSKPGQRIYAGADNLPRIKGGLGIAILSTPKGIITDDEARKEKVGGEVLCTVF